MAENDLRYMDLKFIKDTIKVQKLSPDAVIPQKKDPCDFGYQITLIGRTDGRSEDDVGEVNQFTTGLKMVPPKGYHLVLYPSPELFRHGYMLADNIIYSGSQELIVKLYKFKETSDLDLPIVGVVLFVHETVYSKVGCESVSSDEVQEVGLRQVLPQKKIKQVNITNFS